MKKAYVKPVFLAEAFEMTTNVAGCDFSANQNKAQIWEGIHMCADKTDGHQIGGQQGNSGYVNPGKKDWTGLWGYATNGQFTNDGTSDVNNPDAAFLFAGRNAECDFIWNSKSGPIGIWTNTEVNSIDQVNDSVWISNPLERTASSFISWIGSFAEVFFGNNAGFGQHTPVYDNQKIFS